MNTPLHSFLSGSIFVAAWVIALFFLRFWRKTGDRLFILFSFSFFLLGLERIALVFLDIPDESKPLIYVIRLLSYISIFLAILDKNREGAKD